MTTDPTFFLVKAVGVIDGTPGRLMALIIEADNPDEATTTARAVVEAAGWEFTAGLSCEPTDPPDPVRKDSSE